MSTDLAKRFFARMIHLYAQKWTSHYGTGISDAGAETMSLKQWAHDLAPYSAPQIARAIVECESRYPEWPPTVPQFKQLLDRVPTVEEILDRKNDHGPLCAAIREKLDWYNLTLLSSADMRRTISRKLIEILPSMKRNGEITALALVDTLEREEAIEQQEP